MFTKKKYVILFFSSGTYINRYVESNNITNTSFSCRNFQLFFKNFNLIMKEREYETLKMIT